MGALKMDLEVFDGRISPLSLIAIGAAAVSTLARAIGIIRWLMGNVALANAYADPAVGPAERRSVEIMQEALNTYGGAIGEALGVAILASIWAMATRMLILRDRRMPAWLGVSAIVAGILVMMPALELFGLVSPISIVLSTSFIQLWFVAAGLRCLRVGVRGL
jgi:hypothetical protein